MSITINVASFYALRRPDSVLGSEGLSAHIISLPYHALQAGNNIPLVPRPTSQWLLVPDQPLSQRPSGRRALWALIAAEAHVYRYPVYEVIETSFHILFLSVVPSSSIPLILRVRVSLCCLC
jgi:hypothetical protein